MNFQKILKSMNIVFISIILLSMHLNAQVKMTGGFSFSPHRLILDSKHTNGSYTISNNGKKTVLVLIGSTNTIQTKDGKFIENNDASTSMGRSFRYSPRKILLKPNERQKVRVMIRSSKKFTSHEYRKRLTFHTVDPSDDPFKDSKDMLNINVTIAIGSPVIYWPDNIDESTIHLGSISHKFKDDNIIINCSEIREGDKSISYDRDIYWENTNGKKILISHATTNIIYYPLEKLNKTFIIKDIWDLDKKGKAIVEYKVNKKID